MKRLHSISKAGITIAEQMVTAVAVGIVSLVAYSFLSAGSIMYSRVVQVNAVQRTARSSAEFIARQLYEAAERPVLLNAAAEPHPAVDAPSGVFADGNASVSENFKPSEGILFHRAIGSLMVSAPVNADSTHITLKNMPPGSSPEFTALPPAGYSGMVLAGDIVECANPAFRAIVVSVSPGGLSGGVYSTLGITLDEAVGSKTIPLVTSSQPGFVEAGSPLRVYRRSAFMMVENPDTDRGELRFYPHYLPASAPAFSNREKYEILATNFRRDLGGGRPFSYLGNPALPYNPADPAANFDPAFRDVRLLLQIKAHESDRSLADGVNNVFVVNTAVAWKSETHVQYGTSIPNFIPAAP
jgi:hypothetical protein